MEHIFMQLDPQGFNSERASRLKLLQVPGLYLERRVVDLSRNWLVRAISSGTGHDSYGFVSFSCGVEQGIGHDSDGFIADERAMGVYHFCLDRRLAAPRTAKKPVFYLLNRRLASQKSGKTRTIFAWIDAWQLQTSKNHVHFPPGSTSGAWRPGGFEAWGPGGLGQE